MDEIILGLVLIISGCAHAIIMYNSSQKLLLSDICILSTCVGYGLAPIIAWLAGSLILETWDIVGVVYLAVALYCLGLLFSGFLAKRVQRLTKQNNFKHRYRSESFLVVFITSISKLPVSHVVAAFSAVVVLRLYSFSLGGGLSGINTAEVNLSWSYPMVVLQKLAEPFNIAVTIIALVWLFGRRRLLLATTMLIVVAALAFLDGRRELIYLVITAFFVAYGYYGNVKVRYILYSVFGVVFILMVISPIFLGVRKSFQESSLDQRKMNPLVNIEQAFDESFSKTEDNRTKESISNLQNRPLGARKFLLSVFDAQTYYQPLYGSAFIQSNLAVLPRFVRWDQSLSENPKNYVQRKFGLEEKDAAHTLISAGVADFGIWGALIAGIMMGVFLNFGIKFGIQLLANYPFAGVYVFATLWSISINIEMPPGFESTIIRNVLIVVVFLFLLKAFGISTNNKSCNVKKHLV